MKTYLYLSTAIISVSLATSGNAWAQCVSTQDCATLGYTKTSCPNGGVKCPFGNKWFCSSSGDTYTENECMELACDKLGFKYTCSGSNISGGKGISCNGKYTSCNCSSGYEFTNGTCKELQCVSYGSRKIEAEINLTCHQISNGMYRQTYAGVFPKYFESGGVVYECSNYFPELSDSNYASREECRRNLPYNGGRTTCKECTQWSLP